ncbi:hypothetical protein SAMN05720354_1337 [Nitrosospira sp. Nsp1]|nr:hypothetical protein SAMN05720354_1337 [Nitrosospira sp. Nsp1]
MLPASNIKGAYPSNPLKSGVYYVSLSSDEIICMKIRGFCGTGEECEEFAIDYIRLSMRTGSCSVPYITSVKNACGTF